ncbi:hypothetical protein A4X13_0g6746 [Tilletia indica]|uniref:Uncharacterized protein n=1 Tax=Tilletia indica TaxID=43049 RepID=A0A8T8SNJ5_9BASI|nr:hypothetical protein A4X13_0g6746 [Tilletia indica]
MLLMPNNQYNMTWRSSKSSPTSFDPSRCIQHCWPTSTIDDNFNGLSSDFTTRADRAFNDPSYPISNFAHFFHANDEIEFDLTPEQRSKATSALKNAVAVKALTHPHTRDVNKGGTAFVLGAQKIFRERDLLDMQKGQYQKIIVQLEPGSEDDFPLLRATNSVSAEKSVLFRLSEIRRTPQRYTRSATIVEQ